MLKDEKIDKGTTDPFFDLASWIVNRKDDVTAPDRSPWEDGGRSVKACMLDDKEIDEARTQSSFDLASLNSLILVIERYGQMYQENRVISDHSIRVKLV